MDREPSLLEEADRRTRALIAVVTEDLDARWRRGGHRSRSYRRAGQSGPARRAIPADARPGTTAATGGARVSVWFTVKLDDRPGALARMATALAERGVNIAGIVGIAEDTDGELMLETSDADATRAAFDAAGIAYEAHVDGDSDPGLLSIADIVAR